MLKVIKDSAPAILVNIILLIGEKVRRKLEALTVKLLFISLPLENVF